MRPASNKKPNAVRFFDIFFIQSKSQYPLLAVFLNVILRSVFVSRSKTVFTNPFPLGTEKFSPIYVLNIKNRKSMVLFVP